MLSYEEAKAKIDTDLINGLVFDIEEMDMNEMPEFFYEKWYANKFCNPFIHKIFGDNLRISFPITFALDFVDDPSEETKEVRQKIVDFIYGIMDDTQDMMVMAGATQQFFCDIRELFYRVGTCVFVKEPTYLLESNVNVVNEAYGDYLHYKFSTHKSIKKQFRNFVKTVFPHKVDEYDVLISHMGQINQKNNMTNAAITLSIDPVDYLTASINNYDWSSCFYLYDGSNRAHTASAALANDIIIAYISYRDMGSRYIGVPDKMWRSWVRIGQDFVEVMKGYPFSSTQIAAKISEFIGNAAAIHYINSKDAGVEVDMQLGCCYMYRDIPTAIYINEIYANEPTITFYRDTYGAPNYDYRGDGVVLVEDDCDGMFSTAYIYCACCDELLGPLGYDDVYEVDGNYYCQECFERLYGERYVL